MNFFRIYGKKCTYAKPRLRHVKYLAGRYHALRNCGGIKRAEVYAPLLTPDAAARHVRKAEAAAAGKRQHGVHMRLAEHARPKRAHDARRHRRMQRAQRGGIHALPVEIPVDKARSLRGNKIIVLPQQRGRARHRRGAPGVHAPKLRHYSVPDAVAAVFIRGVGRILHMRRVYRCKVGLYLGARDADDGTDYPPAPRRDALKPLCAAAAGEVEKHGLRVVVGIVRRCDAVAAERVRGPLKKGVAQLARGLLRAGVHFGGIARHIAVLHHKLHAEGGAKLLHKIRVAQRLRPADAVLIMRGVYLQPLLV